LLLIDSRLVSNNQVRIVFRLAQPFRRQLRIDCLYYLAVEYLIGIGSLGYSYPFVGLVFREVSARLKVKSYVLGRRPTAAAKHKNSQRNLKRSARNVHSRHRPLFLESSPLGGILQTLEKDYYWQFLLE
jgi:hypothetical protein